MLHTFKITNTPSVDELFVGKGSVSLTIITSRYGHTFYSEPKEEKFKATFLKRKVFNSPKKVAQLNGQKKAPTRSPLPLKKTFSQLMNRGSQGRSFLMIAWVLEVADLFVEGSY